MTLFEKFVTEGNEKGGRAGKTWSYVGWTRDGADQGHHNSPAEKEEVYAALQYAASCHHLVEKWPDCEELKPTPKIECTFVEKKVEGNRHRTEWCAAASRCRCMRCGKNKKMKLPEKCQWLRWMGMHLKMVGEGPPPQDGMMWKRVLRDAVWDRS